jgi:hypothetical protein
MPAIRPVNVQRVFLNQSCPQAQVICAVPAKRLLIIEDASAGPLTPPRRPRSAIPVSCPTCP